jgi:hypothetical protein
MTLKKLLLSVATLGVISAQAITLNFQAMADGTYGESIWSLLNITEGGINVKITGSYNNGPSYAYLDSDRAGLGVCHTGPTSALAVNTKYPNNGTNRCVDRADDNVTQLEKLTLVFDRNVTITSTTFLNADHGTTWTNGTSIDITDISGTNNYSLVNHFNTSLTGKTFVFANNISTKNDQFYINAMTVTEAVPEPSTIALFGLGLLGMSFLARRRK